LAAFGWLARGSCLLAGARAAVPRRAHDRPVRDGSGEQTQSSGVGDDVWT
jgi:hypothetical protein